MLEGRDDGAAVRPTRAVVELGGERGEVLGVLEDGQAEAGRPVRGDEQQFAEVGECGAEADALDFADGHGRVRQGQSHRCSSTKALSWSSSGICSSSTRRCICPYLPECS
ncbi:MAG: hypothetical protein HC933_03850 [Pleurocapsa sp. SU_196_0]|nr:hypothetical protein [Pleurocapsa sp. SU_196_0]